MRKDILSQLAAYRIELQFQKLVVDGYRPRNPNPMHEWSVVVSCRRSEAVVEDVHRCTPLEFRAIRDGALDLTEVYFKTLMGRMDRVLKLDGRREFTAWCKQQGFLPETLLSSMDTESWRCKFTRDCRVTADFTEMVGGEDKVAELLATTVR